MYSAQDGSVRKKTIRIYSARCTIFPKLCMVLKLVEAIKYGANHLLIQRIFFVLHP